MSQSPRLFTSVESDRPFYLAREALPSRQYILEAKDPLIIFHSHCPDGFASALSAWMHFGSDAEYLALNHDQQPPEVKGRSVFVLDIVFSRPIMEQLNQQAHSLVVLDHHRSAANDMRGFRCMCGHVHFNLNKSACRLAWEYFHPDEDAPSLIRYVEDNDLYRFKIPGSVEYLAALTAGPYSFTRWAAILAMSSPEMEAFMQRGKVIQAHARKLAESMAVEAYPVEVNGHRGLMANAPFVLHTEVGQILNRQSGTFSLMWCMDNNGSRVRIGLRSVDDFDLIPLAKSFGGGGHQNSAGFRLPLNRLPELLDGKLQNHEGERQLAIETV